MGEILLAFDHAVEHGPEDYLGIDISPERIEKIAGNLDGIICHVGIAKEIRHKNKIIKLTANHRLWKVDKQSLVTSVREAAEVGNAVAVGLYFGTEHDGEMMENLMIVKDEAMEYGMPVMVFAYPRGRKTLKSTLYAARAVQEMGADMVKTYFINLKQAKAILDYSFRPVYFAGGEKRDGFLETARRILEMGGNLAVGRNVWQRDDAVEFAKRLRGLK